MSLLKYLREILRPKLRVRRDILEREKRFNESDPSRESWVLDHVYLCEGGLEALKQHPDFNAASEGIEFIVSYYEVRPRKKGPSRKVTVRVPFDGTASLAEKVLKLDLFSRGCNAGVFYKKYQKNNYLYAEAVPASLSGE